MDKIWIGSGLIRHTKSFHKYMQSRLYEWFFLDIRKLIFNRCSARHCNAEILISIVTYMGIPENVIYLCMAVATIHSKIHNDWNKKSFLFYTLSRISHLVSKTAVSLFRNAGNQLLGLSYGKSLISLIASRLKAHSADQLRADIRIVTSRLRLWRI